MVGKQPRVSKRNAADIGILKIRPSINPPCASTSPNISTTDQSNECQGLLKISSPPPPDETDANQVFLERCHYCHRKLEPQQDLLMYGSLTAFCRAECRYAQIQRDNAELERAKSARTACINTRR